MVSADLTNGRRIPGPLRSRLPWVVWGLIIQTLGVGSVAVVMWRDMRNQGLGGHITAELVKFAWHSELHTRAGLTVLAAGAVVYAVGSVVMARPYVSRPATLFIAVPVAAVAGMLLIGVLALVVAVVISTLDSWDLPDFGDRDGRRGRRRQRRR
jgi:hypothetical protein